MKSQETVKNWVDIVLTCSYSIIVKNYKYYDKSLHLCTSNWFLLQLKSQSLEWNCHYDTISLHCSINAKYKNLVRFAPMKMNVYSFSWNCEDILTSTWNFIIKSIKEERRLIED